MYTVLFDSRVYEEDLTRIDHANRERILRTLRKKLTIEPELYGKPLSGNLKGCWKLKISGFRVVYQIFKTKITVFVIAIGARRNKEIYTETAKRLKA